MKRKLTTTFSQSELKKPFRSTPLANSYRKGGAKETRVVKNEYFPTISRPVYGPVRHSAEARQVIKAQHFLLAAEGWNETIS